MTMKHEEIKNKGKIRKKRVMICPHCEQSVPVGLKCSSCGKILLFTLLSYAFALVFGALFMLFCAPGGAAEDMFFEDFTAIPFVIGCLLMFFGFLAFPGTVVVEKKKLTEKRGKRVYNGILAFFKAFFKIFGFYIAITAACYGTEWLIRYVFGLIVG